MKNLTIITGHESRSNYLDNLTEDALDEVQSELLNDWIEYIYGNLNTEEVSLWHLKPFLNDMLVAKPGQLIVRQFPDAFMSPQEISKLCSLICSVSRKGVKIVIETHSDHIINGVLVGIRTYYNTKKENRILRGISHEDVEILFYTPHKVFSIELQENGGLTNVPEGFFDQTIKDNEYILGL